MAGSAGRTSAVDDPPHRLATGDTIVINAPVDSLVVAGGSILVNAPVKGDLIAAGGRVSVNNNIGGKVIAAGGVVEMNGSVGTNLVLAGGEVNVRNGTTVGRDALLSGPWAGTPCSVEVPSPMPGRSTARSGSAVQMSRTPGPLQAR